MIKRFDLHTHTNYSDGEDTVAEKVTEAADRGLALVAITDHFDEPLAHRMNAQQLRELTDVVKAGGHKIPVLLGVETGIEGKIPVDLRGGVDLVIRSVHYFRQPVQPQSLYDPLYWEAYQNEVLALLRAGADVVGHVEGYLPLPLGNARTTFEERRELDRQVARRFFRKDWQQLVARLARENAVAIELHTLSQTPRLDFIALCRDEGCLFSVGSDAHRTSDVGRVDWAFKVIEELKIPKEQLLPYARGWLE